MPLFCEVYFVECYAISDKIANHKFYAEVKSSIVVYDNIYSIHIDMTSDIFKISFNILSMCKKLIITRVHNIGGFKRGLSYHF